MYLHSHGEILSGRLSLYYNWCRLYEGGQIWGKGLGGAHSNMGIPVLRFTKVMNQWFHIAKTTAFPDNYIVLHRFTSQKLLYRVY